MKRFGNYQYVEGEEMTARDKQELGSKFWNKGKWDNFVLPFLPDDCGGMTLIDMGCNAGVFLELAEKRGFEKIIGIDGDPEAINRAERYKKRIGANYEVRKRHIAKCLDELPVSDYTVLAMTHYYFAVNEWIEYIDKLIGKTRNCIIVTAHKRDKVSKAGSSTREIRRYFHSWKETGHVPELPFGDDPFPRRQWSFCFESPELERVPIDTIWASNKLQDNFYKELDEGKEIRETEYFQKLNAYRHNWTDEMVEGDMQKRVDTYNSLKENGLLQPLIVNKAGKICDGSHRHRAMQHLGYKSVIVRRI